VTPRPPEEHVGEGAPAVAILHSQDLIEEWLDHLELSLDDLRRELMGSWMFTYADALSRAGVSTAFMLITERVRKPERALHVPTGAVIWLLPAPRSYSFLRRVLTSRGLRDRRLPRALLRHLAPYLATPLRPLARALRAERSGAIICQEYECPRFDVAVMLGRAIGVPVFPSFHAGDRRSRLERLLHPLSVRACAGVIISPEGEALRAQRVYRIPQAKLARIPNPIDIEIWRPLDRSRARAALGIPTNAQVAVWHGAIYMHEKGLDLLLEAWDRVTGQRPDEDLWLQLVGGGTDADALERQIDDGRLRGVHLVDGWLHDREELRLHLSAADLYVFPSRNGDGHELALLEAMSCGLPIVATEIGGTAETVGTDGAAGGLLVPPCDPEALADAMGKLLDDPSHRTELARRARLRVDARFSLDVVGAQIRDFLVARGMRQPDSGLRAS
jgi:glycosyltransferase involved in cell wall biosynthesis